MVREDPRGGATQRKSGLGYLLAIVALLLFVSEVLVVIPSLTPEVQWNKVYGGTSEVWAYSAQQTSDGGCVLAGETHVLSSYESCAWLLKTDSGGNVQWNRTFGGSGYGYYAVHSVEQASDGGYIFAGSVQSYNITPFWLVKLDKDGNMEWNKTYGYPYAGFGYSLRQTAEGGYITAGYGYSSTNDSHYIWLAKTDSNGNMQWNRTYGSVEYFIPGPYLLQTTDGGYMIATMTPWNGEDKGDALLIKLDQNGDMRWSMTYGGSNTDWAESVLQTGDGGYVFAGSTWSFGAGMNNVWLVEVDTNGTMQWSKTIGGPHNDEAYLIQTASDGGYILTGESSGPSTTSGGWLMKTDSYGNLQWKKTFNDPSAHYYGYRPIFAKQTSEGGYMVAGYAYGGANFEGGFWLMKLAGSPSATTLATTFTWTLTMMFVTIASFVLMGKKLSTNR